MIFFGAPKSLPLPHYVEKSGSDFVGDEIIVKCKSCEMRLMMEGGFGITVQDTFR